MQMKSIFIVGVFVTGLAATPLPADAQVTKSGPGFLLRMKWTKGAVMKYSISASSPMNPKASAFKTTSTMKVKDVKNGVATIESTTTLPSSGSTRNTTPQTTTMKMDSRGKIVGDKLGNMAAAGSPTFPEGPIKIGQSWKGKFAMQQGINLDATYTLKAVKLINGKTIAEIAQKVTGSMGPTGTMNGSGTMTIYGADGSLRNNSMVLNMLIKSSDPKAQPTRMNISMTINRM